MQVKGGIHWSRENQQEREHDGSRDSEFGKFGDVLYSGAVNFCNLCWGVDSVAKSKAHANCLYPYTVDMWTWNGYDQDIFVHDSKWDTNAMQC